MGRRRRGKRSATSTGREEEEEQEYDGIEVKKARLEPHRAPPLNVQLSQDQEDRLGRWSTSMQWIMKIAQDRGCNACLAFISISQLHNESNTCKTALQSFDGQQVSILFKGSWSIKVAEVLARKGGELILISGIGAKVPTSGSEVVYESGKFVVELIDSQDFQSHGWLEIADGQVISIPQVLKPREETAMGIVENTGPSLPTLGGFAHLERQNGDRDASVEEIGSVRSSPLMIRQDFSSPCQTPIRSHNSMRETTSATPGWMTTPAVDSRFAVASFPVQVNQRDRSEKPTVAVAAKPTLSLSKEPKTLGVRLYTPINMLQSDDRKVWNVIALTTTDHTARRSLSGTRDWKITIGLTDVEDSKDKHASCISFNLFSPNEGGIPRCKPGSILMLRGIKVRAFNGVPQGNGYPAQFEWASMDTSESDPVQALTCSEGCALSDVERKELKRQYDWYRKRSKGRGGQAIASRKHQRPLIKLSDIEMEVFFDTTVEIVKVWSGSLPPEIYVTDYTTHPQLFAANDVHLGALSRKELQEQQEDCNDAGNGRVLPISLWDDQQEAINSVHIGMLVRLENVRPKMQPNSYLSGTMGGGVRGKEEKLKVIVVKEKSIVEEFQQRKKEYLEEAAVRRAEKVTAAAGGGQEEDIDGGDEEDQMEMRSELPCSSERGLSLSVPSVMPPPGQKPLSVIENGRNSLSDTSDLAKTTQSRHIEQEEVPTLLEESLSTASNVSVEHIYHMSWDEFRKEQTFVCLGRVYDIMPACIDDIVEVICGLCRSKLPTHHSFCAKCAEEDGKDLQYRFNFALLIESGDQEKGHNEEDVVRIPVLVRGEEARRFLHGFHPKDVRCRKSTFDRLKERLLPLLGSQLVFGHQEDNSQAQKAHLFRFAIRTGIANKADGTLRKKYSLTSTRLGK